jgi:hypothetical protein
LHRDLVAQILCEFVARGWLRAAEFDRGAIGADGIDPDRLPGCEQALEPIQIRLAFVVIVRIADALDRLPDGMINKVKRARAHHMSLVPMRIGIENLLLVDKPVRIGQSGKERGGGIFQLEHDRGVVR